MLGQSDFHYPGPRVQFLNLMFDCWLSLRRGKVKMSIRISLGPARRPLFQGTSNDLKPDLFHNF